MDKKNRQEIAKRIQQIMKQAAVTQKELAELLGISQPAISLYLQGRMPPGDVLLQIARLGNSSVEWLLTGTETVAPPAARIKEPPPAYGPEAVLFDLWKKLSPNIQRDLLSLIRHIADEAPHDS
jgi:transcriptional regulator with XRE-family HTH domain